MVERYDWLLFAIAVTLVAGWVVGVVTSVPLSTSVAAGVLAATPFVYDALFRHPPVPAGRAGRATFAIAWHAVLAVALVSAIT